MATKEQLAVHIKDDNNNITDGTLFFTAFTKSDRTKRAIKIWLICWGGAIAFIPIILIHYIVIPALLIAGPVMAFSRLKQEVEMEKVEGLCPHHNGSFNVKLEKTDVLPKWAYCPECDRGIQIVEKREIAETA